MTVQFTEDHYVNRTPGGFAYTVTDPDVPVTGYVFVDLFVHGTGETLAPWPGVRLRFFDLSVYEHDLGQTVATVTFYPEDPESAGARVPFISFGEPGWLVATVSHRVQVAPEHVQEALETVITVLATQMLTDRRVTDYYRRMTEDRADQVRRAYDQAQLTEQCLAEQYQTARVVRDTADAVYRRVCQDDKK
ncbi:hypothetical protein [Nocardia alni]|uniref:hypothetical protein n=1 Tax=Nocardia alni TaxID=2815723 RepID=UPI001C231CED|nr:hypothetical protein [Nocardia alni]